MNGSSFETVNEAELAARMLHRHRQQVEFPKSKPMITNQITVSARGAERSESEREGGRVWSLK